MSKPAASRGFASIAVHLDLEPSSEPRARLAFSLAARFSAKVIGLAAEQTFMPIFGAIDPEQRERLLAAETERVAFDLEAAQTIFLRAAAGRQNADWRAVQQDPEQHVIASARLADLIILGARGGRDRLDPSLGVRPGLIALEAGRPILVTPPGQEDLSADRILVAWKDVREAKVAISDALPFLLAAAQVVVAAATPTLPDPSQDDVVAFLRRHGVQAKPHWQPGDDEGLAARLLDVARDYGCDLIVAGAYGRSRFREWVFGGVTRDLLEASPLCLFMSH